MVWSHRGAGFPQHAGRPAGVAPVSHRDVVPLRGLGSIVGGRSWGGGLDARGQPASANSRRGRGVRARTERHAALCTTSRRIPHRNAGGRIRTSARRTACHRGSVRRASGRSPFYCMRTGSACPAGSRSIGGSTEPPIAGPSAPGAASMVRCWRASWLSHCCTRWAT
jgi:hypothetical protein